MAKALKTILIADESQSIKDILKKNLEVHGYDILTIDDGEEAINLIYERNPDLVILDADLPNKNGYQICRQIKSEKPYQGVFVIILSSKDQKENEFWAKDCGADIFMTKPFLTSKLEKIVKNYCETGYREAGKRKISIDEEIKKRKKTNRTYALCLLELNAKSCTLFEQKYGQIRYSEMLDKVIELIVECARQHDENMIFEQEEENKFRILLEGKKQDIQIETEKLKKRINNLLKTLHDKEDYQKGFIRRNVRTDQEETAPPLTISMKISFSKGKKAQSPAK